MAKSPFSSAGGGNADTSPYSMGRKSGGKVSSRQEGSRQESLQLTANDDDLPRSCHKRGGPVKAKVKK